MPNHAQESGGDRPAVPQDPEPLPPELRSKWEALLRRLTATGGCVVSFSGGADSALVLAAAARALGDRAVAAIVDSPTLASGELDSARAFAARLGPRLEVIAGDELDDEDYAANPSDRCYYCKRHVLAHLDALRTREGLSAIVDGTNADDLSDDRPGWRAAVEAGVVSPLLEAGVTKAEVRELSRELGLSTWDKPSLACLASRIPHGSRITPGKLAMVDAAESRVRALGFSVVRVRHYGEAARVEVLPGDLGRALATRDAIVGACVQSGFRRAALDPAGYRSAGAPDIASSDERSRSPAAPESEPAAPELAAPDILGLG